MSNDREEMARLIVAARFDDIQECVDIVFDGNHTTDNAMFEKNVSLKAADRLIKAGYRKPSPNDNTGLIEEPPMEPKLKSKKRKRSHINPKDRT